MNENLSKIIKLYSTDTHKHYTNELLGQSKDELIALFSNLLTMYINDKNSSTIREFLTVTIAGYKHANKKLGFNGFKHNSLGEVIGAEAKPQNLQTIEFENYKKGLRGQPKKLNGSGNFTDYTWERFFKNQKQNLNMLFSGFIDGKLIYVFKLPYDDELFLSKLELQLKKRFPNGDISGEYLRSANFTFTHYKESKNLSKIYSISKTELTHYQDYVNRDLYTYLMEK
jgi:hypothetical protein